MIIIFIMLSLLISALIYLLFFYKPKKKVANKREVKMQRKIRILLNVERGGINLRGQTFDALINGVGNKAIFWYAPDDAVSLEQGDFEVVGQESTKEGSSVPQIDKPKDPVNQITDLNDLFKTREIKSIEFK